MKRLLLLILLGCATISYGQHFKLSHATVRSWTSQSDQNQRGAEYRITLQALKKIKNMTLARAWVYDKCYTIEALTVNDEVLSSSNQTIPKGAIVKVFLNVKEVKESGGNWILNNNQCNGTIPLTPNQGKITFEYDVKGTPCSLVIKDVEPLEQIQFE